MIDAPRTLFFRRLEKNATRRETALCALLFDPQAPLPVATMRLSWSSLMASRLRELARAAADTGKPEGLSLPYASLRAAIQVQVPDCMLLSRDLGRPWAREGSGTFMHVAQGTGGDGPQRLCGAMRTWVGMVLRPWAERLDLTEALVDGIDDACDPAVAITAQHDESDLFSPLGPPLDFDRLRHPLLQEVSRRLGGLELFPGLGSVYRIVRGQSRGNAVEFQTWPTTAHSGGLFSMVASVSLQTAPYLDRPLLTVRATRRRWLADLPPSKDLRRQRTLTGYLMGRAGAGGLGKPLAVEFVMPVHKGMPDEPSSPEYLHQALAVRADLARPVAEMVQARGQDVFLGIPYSPQRDGAAPVGGGASTRDQLDLLDAVTEALAPMGMRPLPFDEEATRRIPKRALDFHKALEGEALVADFATALGSNELSSEDLAEAARMLLDGAEPPTISPEAAEKGRRILTALQDANWGRIRRVFGDEPPTIVVVARRESERDLMRAAISGLFGPRITIVERQLPAGVHGPRASLPAADGNAAERFAARVEAWQPLADDLATSFSGCHALVQADKWYDRQHDDKVNKHAGRHALAMLADANVQYLLPAAAGWRGLGRYLHRVQAAVYDLLFGHSALVSEVRSLVGADFPNPETRPRAIIGISVVTQARLRYGGLGGQLCLASRIDVQTGRTTARVGWFDGAMQWTPDWVPFFSAMKHIAGLPAAALGPTFPVQRRSFQSFVAEVVDASVAAGDRPVVLVNTTGATGLWPWLADARIGGPPVIGPEDIDKSQDWAGARLVRVRPDHAGRVAERTTVRYEEWDAARGVFDGEMLRYAPTIVTTTVGLPHAPGSRGRHYWVTGGYIDQQTRGLSVYRTLPGFVPASSVSGLPVTVPGDSRKVVTPLAMDISDEPYRLPNAIDVTAAFLPQGDDPAHVAHLVASLRCGYGHSRLDTALPAPLFFEAKARDYMARFVIDELDEDADEAPDGVPLSADESTDTVADAAAEDDDTPVEGELLMEASDTAPLAGMLALSAESGAASATPSVRVMGPHGDRDLTLLPPWSRLLRPSLAVSLIDGTSLTTGTTAIAQGLASLGVGDGTRVPVGGMGVTGFVGGGTRVPVGGMGVTGFVGAGRASAPGQEVGAEESMDDTEDKVVKTAKTAAWLNTMKAATIPVPEFVTPVWLSTVTSLPRNHHALRTMHRHRQAIEAVSGFAWPEQRPSSEEAAEAIIRALDHPLGYRAIMDVAYLSLEKNKQKRFHPFTVLMNKVRPWRWNDAPVMGRRVVRASARSIPDTITALAEAGLDRDAVSLAYIETIAHGWSKDVAAAASRFGELEAFLAAMRSLSDERRFQTDVFVAVWTAVFKKAPSGNELPPAEDVAELASGGPEDDAGSAADDVEDGPESDDMPDVHGPAADDERLVAAEEHGVEAHGTGTPDDAGVQRADAQAQRSEAGAGPDSAGEEGLGAPGRDDGEGDDPAAAALASWRAAMALLSQAASRAGGAEPDRALLRSLLAPVRQARAAVAQWAAAQPRLVDAAPLVQRGRAVMEGLAALPRPKGFELPTGLDGLSGSVMVEQASFDEAAHLLGAAEANLRTAQDAYSQVKALTADPTRMFDLWEEISASKEAVSSAMQTASGRLDAAGAVLADGAQSAAPKASPVIPPVIAPVADREAAAPPPSVLVVPNPASDMNGAAELAEDDGAVPARVEAVGAENHVSSDAPAGLDDVSTAGVAVEAARAADGDGLDGAALGSSVQDDALDDPALDMDDADALGPPDGPVEDRLDAGSNILSPPDSGADGAAVVPPDEPDPFQAAVVVRIGDLIATQAFGAAYHLRRAAAGVFPDLDGAGFSAPELRLAAMAGHIGHVAMQGSPLLDRVVSDAITAVSEAAQDGEGMLARRLILASACAELAMFHTNLPAPFGVGVLEDAPGGLSEAFRGLRTAVTEGARFGSVTPALLRTVGQEIADDQSVEACRKAVLANIAAFSKMHFNWAPANRIRAALHMRGGMVDAYRVRVEAGDVEAARSFAREYRSRNVVMDLAEKIDASLTSKPKPLDGAARERLLSAFETLTALSAEYVDAADALSSAQASRHKGALQRVAQSVIAAADKAIRVVEGFAAEAAPLLGAACTFAIHALTRLREAAHGRFATVGIHDHLLAVHGPLFWLPGLHYGSSWLPSPYRPEDILRAVLDTPGSPVLPGEDAFSGAVQSRVAEGSFIAARLLIESSGFYGIGDAVRAQMADHCDANLASWRSALKDELDGTRRLIEKIQRMGSLVRIDQASSFAVLDRIDPDALPAEVSLEARTEDEVAEQILDFCSAQDRIQDVRDRVDGLLEPLRQRLLQRLEDLPTTVRPADVERVRDLIRGQDDLVTAGEYVDLLEDGGDRQERMGGNRHFKSFFPTVPETLSKMGKGSLDEVKRAIETGTDLPGLPYSRVPAASRAETLERLEIWRDLRRKVEGGAQAQMVQALLDRLFTAARMSPVLLSAAINGPKLPPKTYAAEMRLSLPEDSASLLLPDFGSLVNFSYHIAVVPRLPSEAEMADLCRDAGSYGMVVMVMSLIDAERRRQLQGHCLAQNRRVLVLDEAILLYALSEAEFRPLTLVECAQPFSFATPYKDYDTQPVPPEMFFGREKEKRKIFDRQGSCIVYGGRRLGKTALLRHVRALHTDAEEGGSTAVGYASLLGKVPSDVWATASGELKPIFPASVTSAAAFRSRIEKWLADDSKRYVLLLLDEADQFIEGDSRQGFKEFAVLQSMMADSFRRFKVVLAGLRNVTRIVRTENSPLKQIASDPLRIGPLMDKELPDAEHLVTRPLAALGYEFKNRGDVWRILSHCYYYPVLVQTFCAGLLLRLNEAAARRPRGAGEITERQVRDAIDNDDIRKEIDEKFGFTIRQIDPRYELITCIVAERVARDAEAGRPDEGMTPVEVLDGAATWWPLAFDHHSALETVKDLLDEMVGLGVLRQTPSGTWSLRSHAILRLLGGNDQVETTLYNFDKRPLPTPFDPRSMRRAIAVKDETSYPCPLTLGQEHDLTVGTQTISVVFGSLLSDTNLVGEALRGAEVAASPDGSKTTVVLRSFTDPASFTETLRTLGRNGGVTLLIVDVRSRWEAGWIEAAMRQKVVKDGVLRLVFVGGPEHALSWARNPRSQRLPGVQVVTLQPWADSYLSHRLGEVNLPSETYCPAIRRMTGGYNRLMAQVFSITGSLKSDRFTKHLERVEQRLARSPTLLADAGFASAEVDLFARVAEWADEAGHVSLEEVRTCAEEPGNTSGLTGEQAVQFGVLMGVLEPLASRAGEDADKRAYNIAPVLLTALRHHHGHLEVA